MESKQWLGYSYHFGSDPKIEIFQADLVVERKIKKMVDTIIDQTRRNLLKTRIQDHLRSIRANVTREQLNDYEWWIDMHLTDDDIHYRIKKYTQEYELLENEAIICLQELESSDKRKYLSVYERYFLILQEMYKILFIKNGIKNNQNEPPDIA
ncbi:hypothetical protein K2X92_04805 [Candidatus Gracilibacteria bacterium]|nr:hypothetical protein [Candidatus Gracilibacteria bacterium]